MAWERNHQAPRDIFSEAGKRGLLGLETAASDGGFEAHFLDKLAFAYHLSQYSMAATFALINSQNIAARLSNSHIQRHRSDIAPLLRSGLLV
ncbi:MAG: acyl-CoA dehydrogenase family protein, partial [Sneathiella sp.]|nr:acyl-CoA dehydrogenase family protein [Sneathiella sp.]